MYMNILLTCSFKYKATYHFNQQTKILILVCWTTIHHLEQSFKRERKKSTVNYLIFILKDQIRCRPCKTIFYKRTSHTLLYEFAIERCHKIDIYIPKTPHTKKRSESILLLLLHQQARRVVHLPQILCWIQSQKPISSTKRHPQAWTFSRARKGGTQIASSQELPQIWNSHGSWAYGYIALDEKRQEGKQIPRKRAREVTDVSERECLV